MLATATIITQYLLSATFYYVGSEPQPFGLFQTAMLTVFGIQTLMLTMKLYFFVFDVKMSQLNAQSKEFVILKTIDNLLIVTSVIIIASNLVYFLKIA